MRNYFLKTDRIGFSIWTDQDINIALSLWGDPFVTKYITAKGTIDKNQIKERLEKEILSIEQYNVQYWPIFDLETQDHIGCCGLRPYDLENGIYELGCHLNHQSWGKGFASEAAKAVINYAFNNLGAKNLFAGHNPNNIASKNFLTKLGFTYTHDEYYPPTGLQHPSYLFYN
ncbi:GNAT family N-acetyltransferase [Bacillus sp. JJ722]|uniref:GNAT family N-acetyltransferase n=1 Tax=Bacillus sp. JJ722 TaxID=3122973 RepID=UPI002FFDD0D4